MCAGFALITSVTCLESACGQEEEEEEGQGHELDQNEQNATIIS